MSNIEAKALALVNEVRREYPNAADYTAGYMALCRAIERHEAFKQEVSDAIMSQYAAMAFVPPRLKTFIITKPKPDLLEQALKNMDVVMERLEAFRAELVTLELEIREKGQ